ncbi:MAG: hypothetical protein AB7O73_03170 [Bacteroidia bacterium]
MEENQSTLEMNDNMDEQAKPIPQFLKVLCILSFIGVGLMVLLSVVGLITNTPEKMEQQIEQVREISPSAADQMEEAYLESQNDAWAQAQPYLGIIWQLITLVGVIQMFNLKRLGFYIYTAAELIPDIIGMFGSKKAMAMVSGMGGAMEAAAITVLIFTLVVDIAFVVMYGMNLKHMK